MNERQINWLRMYKSVELVLDDNQVIVIIIPAAGEGRLFLKGNIKDIDDLNAIQLKNSAGITADKLVVKNDYIYAILKVRDGIKGFAASAGNNTLLEAAGFTESKLNRMSEINLVNIGKVLYDAALPYKEGLAAYQVSEQDLLNLTQKREALNAMLPKKREAMGVSKVATRSMDEIFDETNLFLKNKMDNIMLAFRTTHPDFYQQYLSARIIVDLGHGGEHEKAEGEKN